MKKKRLTGEALVKRYHSLPMQKKMIYAYTIPVISVCMLVILACFPIFIQKYEAQLRYSINQSCVQANNFISNYIENMYYISQLVSDNGDIEDILKSEDFDKDRALGVQYREYWTLADILADIELSNATFRIGIYIPDQIIYSNNNYYFFPLSALKERSDYDEIMGRVNQNKVYFAPIKESQPTNAERKNDYIALFQRIRLLNEKNESKTYVTKVEVPVNELKSVLEKSASTSNTLVYLLDESGNLLLSSNQAYYEKLGATGSLPMKKVKAWSEHKINGKAYYSVYQEVSGYQWKILTLIPKDEFRWQIRFLWLIAIMILLFISVAVVVVSLRLSHYYVGRLAKLNQKMKHLESGDLNVRLSSKHVNSGDEIDEIYSNFNFMTDELKRLMKEHYKLGKNVMSAELKALQAQINPHFLYNTLDLINWGAMDYGADQVAEVARNLGQFYRLSLNHGKSAIGIEDELKHVEAYVKIENVHFDGAIKLFLAVPDEIKKYACLNIILQPFVENAIVHGIAEHSKIRTCTINISASHRKEDIQFTITDDGPGIDADRLAKILDDENSDTNNGYGIKNINFRIKLCYGDKYGISFESEVGVGTKVTILIPALTLEELSQLLR